MPLETTTAAVINWLINRKYGDKFLNLSSKMPTITFSLKDLQNLLGKKLTIEELEELVSYGKGELDNYDKEKTAFSIIKRITGEKSEEIINRIQKENNLYEFLQKAKNEVLNARDPPCYLLRGYRK